MVENFCLTFDKETESQFKDLQKKINKEKDRLEQNYYTDMKKIDYERSCLFSGFYNEIQNTSPMMTIRTLHFSWWNSSNYKSV